MSPRRRFTAIVVLLLVALVLCGWMTIRRIEQELLSRAQVALASANIAFFGLEMDGRDAVLTGFVRSPEESERIRGLVAEIPGVRVVRDLTTLERVADEGPVEPTATVPPRLRIQRLGGSVFVSGSLGVDGPADTFRRALEERFGATSVTWSVRADGEVARPDWTAATERLADLLEIASGNVRVIIAGESAVVSGQVANARAAERLRDAAVRVPGLRWRFELFSASGPLAGGGAGP